MADSGFRYTEDGSKYNIYYYHKSSLVTNWYIEPSFNSSTLSEADISEPFVLLLDNLIIGFKDDVPPNWTVFVVILKLFL